MPDRNLEELLIYGKNFKNTCVCSFIAILSSSTGLKSCELKLDNLAIHYWEYDVGITTKNSSVLGKSKSRKQLSIGVRF